MAIGDGDGRSWSGGRDRAPAKSALACQERAPTRRLQAGRVEASGERLVSSSGATRETIILPSEKTLRGCQQRAFAVQCAAALASRDDAHSADAPADDGAGTRSGHGAARHSERLLLHRRGSGPRGGGRWLDVQVR
eukprot:scaffold123153_cov66-Phaeocystis_antarctica.AAC.1